MIEIRPYRAGDAEGLVRVFRAAVSELAAGDYSPAQIRAWLAHGPDIAETRARCGDGRLTLVAARTAAAEGGGATGPAGEVVAFIDLEDDGHIDLLYAHPEIAGRGVVKALYAELEEAAREAGLERLFVEASEVARRFFEGRGFTVIRRRDFEISGVAIHNYAMEKRL